MKNIRANLQGSARKKENLLDFFILFQGQNVQPHLIFPFLCMKHTPLKALSCFFLK